MKKTISAIVCFFCLSLISNLAVADKHEWVGKPDWVEGKQSWYHKILSPFQHPDHKARKAKKEAEKEQQKAEQLAKKAEKEKERELRKAEQ